MKRLAEMWRDVEARGGDVFMISPPRAGLLRTAAVLFLAEIVIVGVTVNVLLAIVTVPAMMAWAYFYIIFCKVWVYYKYSKFYLIASPAASALSAVAIQQTILGIWGR